MRFSRVAALWRSARQRTVVHSVSMDADRWRRVDELYHAALERDGGERTRYIDKECAGDGELRREVESLLEFDSTPDPLLEKPAWNHLGGAAEAALPQPAFAPGAQLGAYRIGERLGAGGMGEVYRATDVRLTREVALKVMAPEMDTNPEWRQRFAREAQAASRLNHPNIVTIYDIGDEKGVHFIAMEYIPGKTLAQLIPAGGMPVDRAVRYAAQIAGALAKAHSAGVIHRDVKPANIMVTDEGLVKVLDFGVAKMGAPAGESESSVATAATGAGVIVGSAAYMSPEQACGRVVDARSDIFSWGLLLYEMLSGRRAFREDSRFSTLAAVLHKDPESLGTKAPAALAEIVARCLRKDPAERYQNMAEAAAALEEFRRGEAGIATAESGEWVPGYRLLAPLREEPGGTVYKAEDTRLERVVALKILGKGRAGVREARAASGLDHSHIGTVYDAGEMPDGRGFIAGAFYEGGSLEEKIEQGVSDADAVEYVRQAALGLATAHARGIVHGGIRPGCLMLTSEGVVKIVNFGVGAVSGSPYESPEQTRGEAATERSDIWSLGAVLKALAGAHAGRATAAVVRRAMQDDPLRRYGSAQEMARALEVGRRRLRPALRWVAAAALLVMAVGLGWAVVQQRHVRWAREVAMPEIARLSEQEMHNAAMALARQAQQYLSGDRDLAELWNRISAEVTIDTDPPGATVEVKDYLTPGAAWTVLGQTPLHKVRFPWGYSRVRIRKEGRETFEFAHQVQGEVNPDLHLKMEPAGTWPAGMVKVPVRRFLSAIAKIQVLPVASEFYMDRYEVTNREFQQFVDAGGYRDRRYWKEAFVKDGRTLSWEEAMRLLVDATAQPGPATWEAGRFPAGKSDLPVTGVSWYEAAAYAEFAGKSLPTVSHWYAAAYPGMAWAVIRLSNFDNAGLAAPGKYQGLSAAGTFDMGGNAKEWCLNADGEKRYIHGGSWRDPAYQFAAPDAQPAFDRSAENGFRCAKYLSEPDAAYLQPLVPVERDYSKEKPVSDDVFRGFQALYTYEKRDPEGRIDSADNSSPDWIQQRVSYDAGHGNERMPAVLFLPRNASPPFQLVMYFPGAGGFLYSDSRRDLAAFYQLDYLIRGGRAVIYPVYEGTYERRVSGRLSAIQERDRDIDWNKEVERTVDYLETRSEIDKGRMAFLGFSSGSRPAVRLAAYPQRFRTVIIMSGGLAPFRIAPEADPVNFASRLRLPALQLNGRYDFTFPTEEYQRPLFQLLGAPASDKRWVQLEYAHNVGALPNQMRREVLAWLERYLGPVK